MKRFYKKATAVQRDSQFTVHLDGRAMLTPAKRPMAIPSLALAEAVAVEWSAQTEEIDTATMPLTRHVYTAIDGVLRNIDQVVDEITRYAETDLTCYWAEAPATLVAKQAAGWQPLLDWAWEAYGARLKVAAGIMPVRQRPESIEALRAAVAAHDAFSLTALHTLVSITGSLVIGLAVSVGHIDASAAWQVSRIDHDFQSSQWGDDPEAAAEAARAKADLEAAAHFLEFVLAE